MIVVLINSLELKYNLSSNTRDLVNKLAKKRQSWKMKSYNIFCDYEPQIQLSETHTIKKHFYNSYRSDGPVVERLPHKPVGRGLEPRSDHTKDF